MAAVRLGLQVLELAAEAATEAMFGDQPERSSDAPRRGTVWVSADGMMIHDRSSGTEFEVKVGLVFDGALRVGRTRRALTGRTYVGGTGSWMRFAERLTATCAGLGVFDAERILFVSDGAVAIRWIRERSFPHRDRAARLVSPGRAAAVGDRTRASGPAGRGTRRRGAGQCGGPLFERLAAWATEANADRSKRAAKLRSAAGNVAANRRAIKSYRIVPRPSSGPMEKGVDLVVPAASRRAG